MNIGSIIKKLRHERDMTQEQMADFLGITAQAVSRWETGASMPDIMQLPALANIFGVTTDHLLGVDVAANRERIRKITNDTYFNYSAKGHKVEAVNILREALKEFPNSYEIRKSLMRALGDCEDTPGSIGYSNKDELLDDVIAMGEKILEECTDDGIRHSTIQTLCYIYPRRNAIDKAIALAKKMPIKVLSCEALLGHIYKGEKKFQHKQITLKQDTDHFFIDMWYFLRISRDKDPVYTADEGIAIGQKILDIADILFEDGNFGFERIRIVEVYQELMQLYNKKGDISAVLKHLNLAAHHAKIFDEENKTGTGHPEKEYTCLLFRGCTFGNYSRNSPKNTAQQLIDFLKDSQWDPIRDNPEYASIMEDLAQHARIDSFEPA